MTKVAGNQPLSLALQALRALEFAEFPSEFPVQGNFGRADPLGRDCLIHHSVRLGQPILANAKAEAKRLRISAI